MLSPPRKTKGSVGFLAQYANIEKQGVKPAPHFFCDCIMIAYLGVIMGMGM